MEHGTSSPMDQMLQRISGFWIARAIYLAAKLGVADHVHGGPKTPQELAALTGAHGPSLYRVLRALASVGIFAEDGQGRFAATPLAETLRSDVPGSLRAFAVSELGEDHYEAWGQALHSVKTGEIGFDHLFGMSAWEFYERNPENARVFNDSMTELTKMVEAAVMASYDFARFSRVVDVGGGHGGLIASILKANPQARGVLFDAPKVAEGARRRLEAEGLAGRCEAVGGDFFERVPEGGDLYVLKSIIHDWDDERSRLLLENCHRAMAPAGTLLLIDAVIPSGNEPSLGKFIDLIMLVMTGGRERTESEFRSLLAASGFELTRVIPNRSPLCIVEGRRLER